MRVNPDRIKKDIDHIACFGQLEGGGVSRLAFTSADNDAKKYLTEALEKQGLKVTIDAIGNMTSRRRGTEDLAPVMIGSHLDSVPFGGNYDGVLGVVAALEVIRVLDELGIQTLRPIELMNFAAEESSRFGVSTVGSKAIAGHFTTEQTKNYQDKEGISIYDALKSNNLDPEAIDTVRIKPGEIHAFIETHIEQGRVLESQGLSVGIVTSIAAPTRIKVFIQGRADHSGATPMNIRADALTAASEIILGVERIASSEAGPHTVGTVGYANAKPGVLNVIPGFVELGIDIRDIKMESKDLAVAKTLSLLEEVAAKRQVEITHQIVANEIPVTLADKVISQLEKGVKTLGYPYTVMPSGAGHDAMYMAEVTQVGMIFVPSQEGISHNTAEYTSLEDISRGVEVLLETVINLANEK